MLRELLLGLLADDPALEPRDVIVMCPDIEAFAPLISASFGLEPGHGDSRGSDDGLRSDSPDHPGHRLRVRLADRSLRQLNPMLALVARVLELAGSRITAADLLDLLAAPPVRRLFGLTDDDLVRLHDLVPRSGVRWGLDADHRGGWGMGAFGQNTWSAGLDRLLLGVTMSGRDDHFIGTALPMEDIDSSDVDLVGRLGEAVDRRRACSGVREPAADGLGRHPHDVVDGLAAVSRRTAGSSATRTPPSPTCYDTRTRVGGNRRAGRPTQPSGGDWSETALSPADVHALLDDTFRGRPSRTNFRTGTLTFATLPPMRSVPHRVVCLLGIDDGVFPRTEAVTATTCWPTTPGSAIATGGARTASCCSTRSPRPPSGWWSSTPVPTPGRVAERPPAVPVGELLDTLERTVASPDDQVAPSAPDHRHPLQPFDPRNFGADAPGSAVQLRPAGAGTGPGRWAPTNRARSPVDHWCWQPRSSRRSSPLTELVRFFQHPARSLLRARAGLYVRGEDDRSTTRSRRP